jgi:hypothetical protein
VRGHFQDLIKFWTHGFFKLNVKISHIEFFRFLTSNVKNNESPAELRFRNRFYKSCKTMLLLIETFKSIAFLKVSIPRLENI